jgi:putative thioredoxin
MPESAWVKNVQEADFEREVIERSCEVPVVVDFWAPWCGPCRALGPILEKLAAERQGDFILAKVNTDQAPNLASQYGIEGIPAVKAFRDGRPVLEFVGLLPEAQVRAFIDRITPSQADRHARQAADLEANDPAAAEAEYRRVLEQDPANDAALVGLVRLLVDRGQDVEAQGLLGRVTPVGDLGAEAERLGAVLFLREQARSYGDEASVRQRLANDPQNAELLYELGCALAARGRYPEALQTLLDAAGRDRSLASEKVRPVMVKIFYAVGVRSPLADEYRDKLTRLLY